VHRVIAAGVALLLAAACGAHAPRVWSTARAHLPPSVRRVVYADLGKLRASRLGSWLVERAGSGAGAGKDPFGELEQRCGLDFKHAEILWATDANDDSVVFARLPGADHDKLAACAKELGGEADALAWPTPEVVAFSPRGHRAAVERLAGGAGGLWREPIFADGLVDIDYHATAWMVQRPDQGEKDIPGAISLNINLAGGTLEADLHVPAGGWARAWLMARVLGRELHRYRKYVSDLTAEAQGEKVVIRAWLTDDQIDKAMEEFFD
jgi:hypothetical protein